MRGPAWLISEAQRPRLAHVPAASDRWPGAKLATQREIRRRAAACIPPIRGFRRRRRHTLGLGGGAWGRRLLSRWCGKRRCASRAICCPGGFGEVLDPAQGRPHRLLAAPVTVAHEHVLGEPGGEGQPDDLE